MSKPGPNHLSANLKEQNITFNCHWLYKETILLYYSLSCYWGHIHNNDFFHNLLKDPLGLSICNLQPFQA